MPGPSNKRAQDTALGALADLDDRARATMGQEAADDFGGGWSEMLSEDMTPRQAPTGKMPVGGGPTGDNPVLRLKAELAARAAKEKATQQAALQELLSKTQAGFGVPGDDPSAVPFKSMPEDIQQQFASAYPKQQPVGVHLDTLSPATRQYLEARLSGQLH